MSRYVVTDAKARRSAVVSALRVVARVLALLLLAPLELVTALLGLPPASWTARRIAAKVRADWLRYRGIPHIVTPEELTGVVIPPSPSSGAKEGSCG